MGHHPLIAIAAAGLCLTSAARSITYELPQETIPERLTHPDVELIATNCMACHSLDYLSSQPRGKGAQFWRDAVNKMITVYGAPIAPEDVEPLTARLNDIYGKPD